jgi:hypothetical protein
MTPKENIKKNDIMRSLPQGSSCVVADMDEKLARVPAGPGIYIFKDEQKRVLSSALQHSMRERQQWSGA